MIVCYLAGPIDYEKDKGKGWKEELLSLCGNNDNIGFFDPYGPFKFNKTSHKMAKYIHDINMVALNQADILVGSLNRGQTSVGTPIEFYHVLDKKPMLILTDMGESIYMKYIESNNGVEFFDNINKLYGRLINIAKETEEFEARMRDGSSGVMGGFKYEKMKNIIEKVG